MVSLFPPFLTRPCQIDALRERINVGGQRFLDCEPLRSGRRRWLQVDEMPFSRAVTYKLIEAELISSVVVTWPGSKRGRRLIDSVVWTRILKA